MKLATNTPAIISAILPELSRGFTGSKLSGGSPHRFFGELKPFRTVTFSGKFLGVLRSSRWPIALSVLVWTSLPHTQAQSRAGEQSLEERLLRPEAKENHTLQTRSFQTPSSLQTKAFRDERRFQTGKAGQTAQRFESPTFLGLRVPWLARKKMDAEKFAGEGRDFATTTSRFAQEEQRQEKGFALADREAVPVRRAVPVRTATVPGSAQQQINELYQRAGRPLSVEEVRELLNKPR